MKIILYILILSTVACTEKNKTSEVIGIEVPGQGDGRDRKPEQKPEGERPACSDICFNDYRALKGNDSEYNFLNFMNFGHRGVGKCRGHAIVGQKLSELASFSGTHQCNKDYPSADCQRIITQGIRRVMEFKTHKFRGFKNLYDFSSNRFVKEKLKSYIRGISHRYKATQAKLRDTSFDTTNEAIFYELKMRVKERQQPYIGIKGDTVGNHAVIAYDLGYKGVGEVLCIRDSNIILNEGEHCQNYIFKDGYKIKYSRVNKPIANLFVFMLMSDEDKRVSRYIDSRYSRCVTKAQVAGLCK